MVGDINGDYSADGMDIDVISSIILGREGYIKYIDSGDCDFTEKEEQIKTYFGIE